MYRITKFLLILIFDHYSKKVKLDPSLWYGVDVEVVEKLPYDIDGTRVFQVPFDKDEHNVRDGCSWKPWVTSSRKGFRGKRNVQSCKALTFAKTTGVLTKSNSERQTTFNLLKLEENIVADLAMAKASTFPVPLERSVSIHRILALQPFTILELILAQLNVSPSYMQPATLNNSLKHIQW